MRAENYRRSRKLKTLKPSEPRFRCKPRCASPIIRKADCHEKMQRLSVPNTHAIFKNIFDCLLQYIELAKDTLIRQHVAQSGSKKCEPSEFGSCSAEQNICNICAM